MAESPIISVVLQKEALDLTTRIWPDLDALERDRVIDKIISIPIVDSERGHEHARSRRDWQVFLRLSVIDRLGECMLPLKGQRELDRLRAEHPSWQLEPGERAYFLTWHETHSGPLTDHRAEDLLGLTDAALATRLRDEQHDREGLLAIWFEISRQNPSKALAVLASLPADTPRAEEAWASALNGLVASLTGKEAAGKIGPLLPTLSVAGFTEPGLRRTVGQLLVMLAQASDGDPDQQFWTLWDRLLDAAVEDGECAPPANWMQEAINRPTGDLATALLAVFSRERRKPQEGLGHFQHRFDRLLGQSFGLRFSRVVLAGQLSYLHAVAREWTEQNLVSRMHWDQSDEAAALWQAYGFHLRISTDLWGAVQNPYFQLFEDERLAQVADARGNLVALLAIVGIDLPAVAPPSERARGILTTMRQSDRDSVARWIWSRVDMVRGVKAPEAKAEARHASDQIWRDHAGPWIERTWPHAPGAQSSAISERFACAAVATGNAFPEAVNTLQPILVPINHSGTLVRWIADSPHPDQHAEATLKLIEKTIALDQIIDASTLRVVLEKLRPHIGTSRQFMDFDATLRRREGARH